MLIALVVATAGCGRAGEESQGHSHGAGLSQLGRSEVGEALEAAGVTVCHAYEDPNPENAIPLSDEADILLVGMTDCEDAAEREIVVAHFRTPERRDESLRRIAAQPEFWLMAYAHGAAGAVAVSRRNESDATRRVEEALRDLGGRVAFDHRTPG